MPGHSEPRHSGPWQLGRWALFLMAMMSASAALGSDELPREYRIKAAYLYNLIKFVTWPSEATLDSSSPLTLCIYGYNPFGVYLEKLEDRLVRNRPLAIRYVAERQSSAGCNLLFISQHNTTLPPELTSAASNPSAPRPSLENAPRALLTVSDDADFLSHGGLIALVAAGNNIHLDINLTRARRLDLQFSANLLEIARRLE